MMLLGKKTTNAYSKKPIVITIIILFLVTCLLTVLTSVKEVTTLSDYLSYAFARAKGGVSQAVVGGAFLSLFTFYSVKYLTYTGSIIAISVLILICLVIASKQKKAYAKENKELKIAEINAKAQAQAQVEMQAQFNKMAQNAVNSVQQSINPQNYNGYGVNNNQNLYNQNGYGYNQNQPNTSFDNSYQRNELYGSSNTQNHQPYFADREKHDKSMEILYGAPKTYSQSFSDGFSSNDLRVDEVNRFSELSNTSGEGLSSPIKMEETVKDYSYDEGFSFNYKPENISAEDIETQVDFDGEEIIGESVNDNKISDFLKSIATNTTEEKSEEVKPEPKSEVTVEQESEYAKKLIENMPINYKYKKPPVSIFKTVDNSKNNYEFEVFKAEVKAKILNTLKTFGVETDIARVFKGPAVTRFDIEIPPDVPMNKVTKLQNDLNLRIAAKSAIRMIAPIPNTSYVGIEVPNKEPDSVSIKDIIVSDEFINT